MRLQVTVRGERRRGRKKGTEVEMALREGAGMSRNRGQESNDFVGGTKVLHGEEQRRKFNRQIIAGRQMAVEACDLSPYVFDIHQYNTEYEYSILVEL